MNIWHDISPERIAPEKFSAVVEISKGGKNKYDFLYDMQRRPDILLQAMCRCHSPQKDL